MIQEVIVTSQNSEGVTHIAPMGIHVENDQYIILPFKPSTTLNNILHSNSAVINYCDDVRIFAGCLTGKRDWPLSPAEVIEGQYLTSALSHREVTVQHIEDDDTRPRLYCKTQHLVTHQPFLGFNRAQYSVLEAAILVSRLHMLSIEKINSEIAYLQIGLEKTASKVELEAWEWLMEKVEKHKQELSSK